MTELLQLPPEIYKWIVFFSLLMFFGSLLLVPYLITRIPEDYFSHAEREAWGLHDFHPAVRIIVLVIKNMLGLILLLLGISMLVLPGQGILTMVIGLTLLNFPGKYQFERWLVSRPRILRSMNWFRKRAGKSPLEIDKQGQN